MCGRLVNNLSRADYTEYFGLETALEISPTFNAAITHRLPVVRLEGGQKVLAALT